MTESNYNVLLNKLDEFIRKYYKNELLKGAIYSVSLFLCFFLTIALVEHFGHFDKAVRGVLFFSFIITNIIIFSKWLVLPLLKLNKLGKTITHEQASQIIGRHFTSIEDKLLNVLQLKQSASSGSSELIEASINQKITELKPVPFSVAVDLSQNKKYLKYALVPLAFLIFILFSAPSIITGSTRRIVDYDQHFEKEAPFKFEILNKSLEAVQQEDFLLEIKLTGNELPENVYLSTGNNEYKLTKENIVNFSYLFKNIQASTAFRLTADGFESREYEIKALPNPIILGFSISLDYPAYTGKKDEVIRNTGDLIIPAGTKASWKFDTRNTERLKISFNDTAFEVPRATESSFAYSNRLFKNKTYSITSSNEFLRNKDSIVYAINVISDQYPAIEVDSKKDSLSTRQIYFRGSIKDDYGFSGLSFNYSIKKEGELEKEATKESKKPIAFGKNINQDIFFHSWSVEELALSPGDQVEYYFEVFDNDGVNGAKSTRTSRLIYKAPTLEEISANTEKNNEKIKEDIQESIKKAKELQKDMNEFNKKLVEKKTLSYEEKKKLQDILEKQKQLEQKVNSIKNENKQNQLEQSEFKTPDESLAEKQKQLQELFEKLMSPEMKEMFKEMEKLLENMDKNKTQEMIEKMKLESKDLEKELDRSLELFKQLELEQKLNDIKEKLNDLSKKQEELSKKTQAEEKKSDNKELQQKQEELNKSFEDVKKDLNELEQKNKELETPNSMEDTEKQEQEIEQEMKNSSESLEKQKNKKASDSQKKASEKMSELSEKLQQMQSKMQNEQNEEDMNALREILENLIQLSFNQEELIKKLNTTDRTNPEYVKIAQQQKKLKDDAKMIEDSLFALSKRQVQIQSFVNKEISAINMNMEQAIKALAERQNGMAANRQQFVMTGVNNLALLLSESLEQMQQQMQQSKSGGGGSCKKPGGKSKQPSMTSMREMQQKLNQQMQKLKDGMNNPNGQKSGKGSNGMSEELAKLAAQQQALRQQLQQAIDQMNKDGKDGKSGSGGNMQKMAEQMDKTETELVNKMITNETLKRQQEILTRLLEAEKAEKERELDVERKANQAKNEEISNPAGFFEYNRQKSKEAELLKTVPPSLNTFYKNKVSEYFNNVIE